MLAGRMPLEEQCHRLQHTGHAGAWHKLKRLLFIWRVFMLLLFVWHVFKLVLYRRTHSCTLLRTCMTCVKGKCMMMMSPKWTAACFILCMSFTCAMSLPALISNLTVTKPWLQHSKNVAKLFPLPFMALNTVLCCAHLMKTRGEKWLSLFFTVFWKLVHYVQGIGSSGLFELMITFVDVVQAVQTRYAPPGMENTKVNDWQGWDDESFVCRVMHSYQHVRAHLFQGEWGVDSHI